jgi:hypothetical protein
MLNVSTAVAPTVRADDAQGDQSIVNVAIVVN